MAVTPKRLLRSGLFSFVFALILLAPARAQDTAEPASPEIISRYEQILEREPEEGVSFDKLIQIYEQGDGLEKLDARWAPISAQAGAKGAIYSLLRGLLADRMGKTDAARTLLQTATVAAPTDYHTWLALGDFEARDGKLPAAIAAFQKGLATPVTGEDQLALFHKLGQAQERNLDDAGALATWQKMTTTFPQDTFALEEAGSAELDASQFDEARKTFQKLVDLAEPNSMARVQALMKLAGVDDREGKTDAAVHGYEAILPLTADASWLNREIRAQIEQVYRREDDLAGLATYYQKWTTSNPKDVDALLLWSGTLTELGKKDEALDALRKAAALAPDRHEVRQSLALGLVEAEKFDEAITVETALTADDPTEPRYWETLGEALFGKTQPPTPESKKAVLDAWAHIAPADSKDVAAILQVAELCRTHQFNDEALAGYNRALAITPDATDIREKAAQLLVDLHRQDEAWKLLDAMAEGAAATAANELKLAQIDDRLGRKDASAAAIQAGLALEPGNFDLLSMEWSRLAEAQKWSDAAALYDKLLAAAPNDYFADVVQGRQAQALTSAGQLDDVEKKLGARLGGQPPLTEGELGLLTRILVQQNDDDTVEKAFAEASQRFPNSASLLQLQVDYARHAGKPDEAVSGLRHMIALKPQQKGDYLGEIVRIRQDQQNFDEALKVAQEIIDASPASTDGYLLYSDVAFAAGKTDDGIARLQTAIKLSDKPNEVRTRLAQHEMELGQPAKARAVYDDAFAAADTPQDKLAIVRAMVPAYFQTGQIDDLIARFRQEQNSEEGGWRYGLFLSAIYDEMEDFGAARRELAKSLAVRPKDTALLHSLIDLADKGGDDAEVLRYREMLADADPSVENQRTLAEEYAQQDKPADAWRVVTANQPAIMKDPLPWKDLLSEFTDPAYANKMRTLLETAIRAQGSTFEGQFALAQFQVQQRDLDAAQASLWNILGMPLPPPPPPPKASSSPMPGQVVFSGMVFGLNAMQMSPEFRRIQAAAMAQNEYFQLAAAAQNPGNFSNRARMMRTMSQSISQQGGMFGGGMSAPTALNPQEIQDRALVYLAAMSVQQNKAADFLKELEDKIAAWHWNLPQRLVAYAMIQARAPLLDAIEEQAKTGKPDRDLDQFCMQESGIFQQVNGDTTLAPRAQAAQKILSDRLQKEMPQSKDQLALQKIYQSGADSSPAGLASRKAAIHDYLATIDNKDPATVLQAIELARGIDDLDMARQEMAVLAAMNRATWSVMLTQQFNWLPMNLAQQPIVVVPQRTGSPTGITPPTPPKVDPAARIALILDAFELSYPAVQPPNVSMMTTSMPGRMGNMIINGMVANNGMMPANRYFTQDRITALQQVFSTLQQQKLVDEFEKQLAARAKKFTDWRAVYPQLTQIYFQWWADQKDAALASAREMLSEDPSDDNRRLVAWMLTEQQKYADALPLLEAVTARYGTSYIETQLQILHTARLAKDNDAGARAAQRLLALRLPQQEQMQFLDDLRAIGMQDKATEIMQHQQAMYNRNAGAQQAAVQSVRTMQDALNRQDKNTARDIAHQILSHDPNALNLNGNGEFATREAINVLQRLGELDAYLADIEKQLDANPNSLRLNWIAAQVYQQMPNNSRQQELNAPLPPWTKLDRKGDQWSATYSWDNTTWSAPLSVAYTLPAKYYLGVSGRQNVVPFGFDQAVLTGKVDQMPLVNPATSPIHRTPGLYAIATNAPPAAPNAPPAIAGPTPSVLSFTDPLQSKSHPPPPPGQMQITFNGGFAPVPRTPQIDFSFQPVEGDTTLAVHQASSGFSTIDPDHAPAITAAATLDLDSPQVRVSLVPPGTFILATRDASLAEHKQTANIEVHSLWLKLKRNGPVFTGSTSLDGQAWQPEFTVPVPLLGNGDAMAGFVTTGPSNAKTHVDWKNVQVNGTPASGAPPAPTPAGQPELPAPWHVALAGSPDNATAQVTGSELTMDLPGTAPLVPTPSSNLVYQMLHGDGEITAQLGEISTDGCSAALTFRAGLAPDAPSIEFYCRKDGHLGYIAQSDTTGLATKYMLKVAQLQPGNINMLINLAQRLTSEHHEAESADLYLTLLKSDVNSALPYVSQMDEAFRASGRSKELVDLLDAWNPPPFNPMFGGMVNTGAISQLADQMRSNGDLSNAERLYRKALSVQGPQPNDEAAASLVELLEQEGKRDEASAEIQTLLLDQDAAAPAPVLGYAYNNNNWSWMFGMSWNQDGPMLPAKLRLLQLDSDLGGAPKLKAALQAKLAGNTRSLINGLDPNNVMLVLLAIVSGEPDASALAEKLVKSETGGSTNISVLVAEEMSLKPAMRREAWQVLQDAVARTGPNNGNFSLMLDNMARKIAEQIGDPALVVKTLRHEIDDYQAVRNVNPNFINIDQEITFMRSLIAAGLKKEAVAELAFARNNQQATNKYFSDQLDALANEMGVGDGKVDVMPIAFGFAPGKSAHTVDMSWCLGSTTNNNGFDAMTQPGEWDDSVLVRPSGQTLVLQAADDEGQTFSTIATFPQVATRGVMPVKLPPGVSVFRALLLPPGATAPTTAQPNAPGQPRPSSFALFGAGANLLENPDLAVTKNAAGLPTITGWNGLWPDAITEEKGGPAPDHRYRSLARFNTPGISQIMSSPVPITPGTTYVLSGWMRGAFNVGVYLRDAAGKQVEQRMLNGGGQNTSWKHFSCRVGTRIPGNLATINLPPNAATIQLTFQGNQTIDVALLSLRPLNPSAPDAPAGGH